MLIARNHMEMTQRKGTLGTIVFSKFASKKVLLRRIVEVFDLCPEVPVKVTILYKQQNCRRTK
jgi:hypothetical protein